MNWILIGTLLGSVVTSTHDNREACEGRAVMLREKGAVVQCAENKTGYSGTARVPLNQCNGLTCLTPVQ